MAESMEDVARSLGDGYTLQEDLGSSFGWRTFVGFDAVLSRRVVIRMLEGISNSPVFREAMKEAAALAHPGIIQVLGVGADGEVRVMYASAYVEGPSLDQVLSRRKRLPVVEACRIAAEVAEVLQYAHERGIMHHDLSPRCVHIDGRAVVGGLGVAAAIRRSFGGRTGPNYIGDPAYLAPEQIQGKRSDARTDVYMLGAVLYEMLAGKPAFTGRSAPEILLAKMTADAPDVRHCGRDVPPPIAETLSRCLQWDPAARHASVSDLTGAMAAAGHGMVGRGIARNPR